MPTTSITQWDTTTRVWHLRDNQLKRINSVNKWKTTKTRSTYASMRGCYVVVWTAVYTERHLADVLTSVAHWHGKKCWPPKSCKVLVLITHWIEYYISAFVKSKQRNYSAVKLKCLSLTSQSTHYRLFQRRVFPVCSNGLCVTCPLEPPGLLRAGLTNVGALFGKMCGGPPPPLCRRVEDRK